MSLIKLQFLYKRSERLSNNTSRFESHEGPETATGGVL